MDAEWASGAWRRRLHAGPTDAHPDENDDETTLLCNSSRTKY